MTTSFIEGQMTRKYGALDTYRTPCFQVAPMARIFPSLYFYARMFLGPVPWLCRRAAKGHCDDMAWVYSSVWLANILEASGCRLDLTGLANLRRGGVPRVYVANHMSTLETFVLPAVIRPEHPVTFVVKKSLTTMPFFGAVMRSRYPVVVSRSNPREDLAVVLEEGTKRLRQGISIIVFPQSTRSVEFSREHFNSIGVKLARRANVPVVPVALKTDAWAQGRAIKDFGPIRPQVTVHFSFGEPFAVEGNGKKEQRAICDFIEQNLHVWNKEEQGCAS